MIVNWFITFVWNTAVWAHNPCESELTTLRERSGFQTGLVDNEMTWVARLPVVEIIPDNDRFILHR